MIADCEPRASGDDNLKLQKAANLIQQTINKKNTLGISVAGYIIDETTLEVYVFGDPRFRS